MAEKGSLSINSENMFPIIKKWLYSDHDIFYRELISNGCDAITKLKKLDVVGDYTLPEDYKARIDIVVSPADRTIAVARKLFWQNIKTRPTMTRSSVTSDWASTAPLWWPIW